MKSLIELSEKINENINLIKNELTSYLKLKLPIILPIIEKIDDTNYDLMISKLNDVITLIESPVNQAYEIALKNNQIVQLKETINFENKDLTIRNANEFIKKQERKIINKTHTQVKEIITPIINIGELDTLKLGNYNSLIWGLEDIIENKIKIIDLNETGCIDGGEHEIYSLDEIVCKKCGLVIEQELIEHEKRAYNIDEIKKRRHTEPRWREYGPRTIIDKADINTIKASPKQKKIFYSLCRIQGNLIDSLERNYWDANPMLNSFKEYVNNEAVIEYAWRLYKQVAKKKLTMGRTISGFVSASVYAAMKKSNIPIIMDEFMQAVHKINTNLTQGHIISYYRMMINEKITKTVSDLTLTDYINRQGNNINLHPTVINKSISYTRYFTTDKGTLINAKTATGIISAIFYHVLKRTNFNVTNSNEYYWPKTQKEIADSVGTTEVTLRSRELELQYFIKLQETAKKLKLSDKSIKTGINTMKDYLEKKTVNKRAEIEQVVNTITYILIDKLEQNDMLMTNFLNLKKITSKELKEHIKEYFPKTYKKYYST